MTIPNAKLPFTIAYFASCYLIALQFGGAFEVLFLALILSFVLLPTLFIVVPLFSLVLQILKYLLPKKTNPQH